MESNSVTYRYLDPQSRKIIYNVYHYFVTESRRFSYIDNGYFKNVRERLAAATGISETYLARLLHGFERERLPKARVSSSAIIPLKQLLIKRKDIFNTGINKVDRTVTYVPLDRSSLQARLDEPISVDTDSDDSVNDKKKIRQGITKNTVDNTNSLPVWQNELPELSNPNLMAMNPQKNVVSPDPPTLVPSELPKLIKYGPSRGHDEVNNNLPTFMNRDSRYLYLDDAIMSNLPPLVRCPVSKATETPTINQEPIYVRTENIMSGGRVIDGENNYKTPVLVLSPVPVFVSTDNTAPTNAGVLPNNADILPNNAGILPTNAVIIPNNAGILPNKSEILPTHAEILPNDPGILPTNAGLLSTNPMILPTNPGIVPTNAGIIPTNAEILPNNAGILPTNAGIFTSNPGILPTNPGILPTNAGILPTNAGVFPGNAGIIPNIANNAGTIPNIPPLIPHNTNYILSYGINIAPTLNTEVDPKIVKVESLAFETLM